VSAACADPVPAGSAAFDPAALVALGVPVTSLALDSRSVQPGDVFVACPGRANDGRAFIAQAIARGAKAVLWEASDDFRWNSAWPVPNLALAGLHEQLGALASHVYGHPSRSLWVVAVTGTNGKTSVTRWIAQALTASGVKCAVIGTLGAGYPDEAAGGSAGGSGGVPNATAIDGTVKAPVDGAPMTALANTTPDAVTLHAVLARFVREGARAVALEASSIALDQHRLDAVKVDVAVFTNLSRDHLDYHASFEAYGAAKARLFDWPTLAGAVINLDDEFGRELSRRLHARGVPVLGFGLNTPDAVIAGHDLRLGSRGMQLEIVAQGTPVRIQSPLLGAFNASNLLATAGVLMLDGIPAARLPPLLGAVNAPPGRMQPVVAGNDSAQPLVVVDYAHTPDALANALATLRAMLPVGGRLACVFGCGGDRDPGKRPLMGEIAARLADRVWVTSDNPRSEAPDRIIDEVLAGVTVSNAVLRRDADRARAIEAALAESAPGDIVLIAGKGHEAWQEVAGVKQPFDDRVVAVQVLRSLTRAGGLSRWR